MSGKMLSENCFPSRINGISMQKMVMECFPICCTPLPKIVPWSSLAIYISAIQPVTAAKKQVGMDGPYFLTEILMPSKNGSNRKYKMTDRKMRG